MIGTHRACRKVILALQDCLFSSNPIGIVKIAGIAVAPTIPRHIIYITMVMAFTSDSLGFSCVWRPPQARQLHTPHRGTDDKIPFLTCQHIPILGQETRSRKGRAALSKGKTGGFCGQGLCEASAEPWGTFRFGLRRSLVFVPGLAIG